MQFVLPWKKGVAPYESEFSDLEVKRPERCPHCGCGKFHKWGKYERYVVEEESDARIPVRRIRCVKCGGTFSYLPSFCLSGISCSADFLMRLLGVLILKTRVSLGEWKRRAFLFLRRFARLENLWLTFLRARGFGDFPADKRARLRKIFAALLEFHRNGSLSADFLRETGRRLMSVK
jgi:hypothetical protein